jgi:hypothetical protein
VLGAVGAVASVLGMAGTVLPVSVLGVAAGLIELVRATTTIPTRTGDTTIATTATATSAMTPRPSE